MNKILFVALYSIIFFNTSSVLVVAEEITTLLNISLEEVFYTPGISAAATYGPDKLPFLVFVNFKESTIVVSYCEDHSCSSFQLINAVSDRREVRTLSVTELGNRDLMALYFYCYRVDGVQHCDLWRFSCYLNRTCSNHVVMESDIGSAPYYSSDIVTNGDGLAQFFYGTFHNGDNETMIQIETCLDFDCTSTTQQIVNRDVECGSKYFTGSVSAVMGSDNLTMAVLYTQSNNCSCQNFMNAVKYVKCHDTSCNTYSLVVIKNDLLNECPYARMEIYPITLSLGPFGFGMFIYGVLQFPVTYMYLVNCLNSNCSLFDTVEIKSSAPNRYFYYTNTLLYTHDMLFMSLGHYEFTFDIFTCQSMSCENKTVDTLTVPIQIETITSVSVGSNKTLLFYVGQLGQGKSWYYRVMDVTEYTAKNDNTTSGNTTIATTGIVIVPSEAETTGIDNNDLPQFYDDSNQSENTNTIVAISIAIPLFCLVATILAFLFYFTKYKNKPTKTQTEVEMKNTSYPENEYRNTISPDNSTEMISNHPPSIDSVVVSINTNSNNDSASTYCGFNDSLFGGDENTELILPLRDLEIQFASLVIKADVIKIGKILGKGSNSEVKKGLLDGTFVAVKILKDPNFQVKEFKEEVNIMSEMPPHPNVVLFRGVVLEPLAIVTDYCDGGSIKSRIDNKSTTITINEIVEWCKDITRGMIHLHGSLKDKYGKEVIHRDLAARNILINRGKCQICDFGMSRMKNYGNNVGQTKDDMGPVKWMAPECFSNQYSVKSDVFSFGVILYEMITRKDPWFGHTNFEVHIKVVKGERMTIPDEAPEVLQMIMKQCWSHEPADRPYFKDILVMLNEAFPEIE